MSSSVIAFMRNYALALLLAILAHILLLAAIWSVRFSVPAVKPVSEPVMTYFYQPVPIPVPESMIETVMQPAEVMTELAVDAADTAAVPLPEPTVTAASAKAIPAAEEMPAESQAEAVLTTPLPFSGPVSGSLTERALQRAAPSDMDMAYSSYQQFRQQQQQPQITVDKKHQQLSQNPQQQVMMTLNNGMQVIRTRDGCRLADPGKDGFEALMAARKVPCGDEVADTELLKQILSKHIKR